MSVANPATGNAGIPSATGISKTKVAGAPANAVSIHGVSDSATVTLKNNPAVAVTNATINAGKSIVRIDATGHVDPIVSQPASNVAFNRVGVSQLNAISIMANSNGTTGIGRRRIVCCGR